MISKVLLFVGIACLALYGFFVVQAHWQQAELEKELYRPHPAAAAPSSSAPTPAPHPTRRLQDGDLFGRLEIPRLNMSVMVMEGDADRILRLGAGHVPGTPMAIAGHRDTFFRPLKDIQLSDTILITTLDGTEEYHVVSTRIVEPNDTSVLARKEQRTDSGDLLSFLLCRSCPQTIHRSSRKELATESVKSVQSVANLKTLCAFSTFVARMNICRLTAGPVRLARSRTRPFQGCNTGSNPVRDVFS